MKITVMLKDKEIMTIDKFSDVNTYIISQNQKDYAVGKLSFTMECGRECKQIPARIYKDGRIVGETEDGYIVEGRVDLNNLSN